MTEKEPTLKGKGLEIGRPNVDTVLLGRLARRLVVDSEMATLKPTLKGKGLEIGHNDSLSDNEEGEQCYISTKNGDAYVIKDYGGREGLVRLRNLRNGSIATLSIDVLSDPERFTLDSDK